jgi:hypothetical protein
VDLEKVNAIMKWSTLENVTDVKYSMDIANYYRGFIKGFINIAHPITYLPKKGIKFEWTQECDENFQQLKKLLTSALIMKIVDSKKDFDVCTDACIEGLFGVLTQDKHVICYESRKLK